jgi:hypothetical protein
MVRSASSLLDSRRRHFIALRTSSRLTSDFRRKHQAKAVRVTPEKVIRTLHRAGVTCVLLGTHGLGAYRDEPRATQDVDVLVTKSEVQTAVRALQSAYPKLTVKDSREVARFIDPATGMGVIDVWKPVQRALQAVFRYTISMGETHKIQDLEMALVSKFVAMISPNRRLDKKLIDAGDFTNVALFNRGSLDLEKLARLGEKVYPGGSAEIVRIIVDLDAGRTIRL